MNIIDYIPYGKQNAVSRQELVTRTGMSDRAVLRIDRTAVYNGKRTCAED